MSSNNSEEPKIIIDEDWKDQVQREKETLKQNKSTAANDSAEVAETTTELDQTEPEKADDQPPPPASFEFLVSGMATQAFAAMGLIPGDDGKPFPVRLDFARHYIDLLAVIENKTEGNLSDAEKNFLQSTLHQLRMMFVSVKK